MSLNPDIVVELAIWPQCLPEDILESISQELGSRFLPPPGDDNGAADGVGKTLTVCAPRPALGKNVISIGVWTDASGYPDSELKANLASQNLLRSGKTVGLLVTTNVIRTVANAAWKATDKSIGHVYFSDSVDLDIQRSPNEWWVPLTMRSYEFTTTVTGKYKRRFMPNFDFTFQVTDRILLRPPGSAPPLTTESSTDLDIGLPSLLRASFLIGLLSPMLGAIVFFAAEPISESQVPNLSGGIGAQIAAQWPSGIFTPKLDLPSLFEVPPGKVTFLWTDLIVDEQGVQTLGNFGFAIRLPSAMIVGPRSVTISEALMHKRVSYGVNLYDLRPPFKNLQWSGGAGGTEIGQKVNFYSAGEVRLGVSVEDADGLTASDEIIVKVAVRPLEPGQQPY
jgi:hypothetical protein